MRSIAIITARGGSKRIPKKNIKDFCGRPIISYSIQAALESGLFDEVMVSTDSGEIAQIAKQYGARVPFLRHPMTWQQRVRSFRKCLKGTKQRGNFSTRRVVYIPRLHLLKPAI